VGNLSIVGSYAGSASPYGTFDQGGNVWEWNEAILGAARGFRGGSFPGTPDFLAAADRGGFGPSTGPSGITGFRLAMVPEPGTGVLVLASLLGLAAGRRPSA